LNRFKPNLNLNLNSIENPLEIGKWDCALGLTVAHGHSRPGRPGLVLLAHASGLWQPTTRGVATVCAASAHRCAVTVDGRQTWQGALQLVDGGTMEPVLKKWSRGLSHSAATSEPTQDGQEGGPHRGVVGAATISKPTYLVCYLALFSPSALKKEKGYLLFPNIFKIL
jgi:hypothetical protein